MDFLIDDLIGEVMTLKLTSGEELITKIVSQSKNYLEISEPVSIAPGPQGIGLMPSMFTADTSKTIRLHINAITLFALTQEDVKMKYIQSVTGLTVPSKKIVMG